MENSLNKNESLFNIINTLIINRNYIEAENILNSTTNRNSEYHYLYGLILKNKAWFDAALPHFKKAVLLSPNNTQYKDELISLMGRHRYYSDDYYNNSYRRRNHGCSCCCCDDCCDCCDCGNFSCCDLICLDQCCECMGGDLIDCI